LNQLEIKLAQISAIVHRAQKFGSIGIRKLTRGIEELVSDTAKQSDIWRQTPRLPEASFHVAQECGVLIRIQSDAAVEMNAKPQKINRLITSPVPKESFALCTIDAKAPLKKDIIDASLRLS
jgi:hypothetical protein